MSYGNQGDHNCLIQLIRELLINLADSRVTRLPPTARARIISLN